MFFICNLQRIAILAGGLFMGIIGFSMQSAIADNNVPNDFHSAALLTENAQITTLSNGLTVYIIPDERFPLVSTRLYVKAGSSYESTEDAGISHVLEHMVFKGTAKRKSGDIAKEVEAAGGYLNAATGFDYTKYIVDLPAKHWALGLDIVHDMAFNPTLDDDELASEKEVILAELQRGNDNPHQRIFKELQTNTLKGTAYAHPIIGYEESIMAVSPKSMRDYIAKYYQPQNMLLMVVGNIKAEQVLAESQKIFGDLKNTGNMHPVNIIDASGLDNATINIMEGPWNKVYLGLALPVPGFNDVRSLDLDVLAHVLGGDATSYLYKKYKYDQQLVDSISVANYSFERVGLLYFSIQLEAKNLPTFWKEFITDLATLKADVFSKKDMERAVILIEDSTHRAKETVSGLASYKGYAQLFLGGEQGEQNMLTTLAAINHGHLQKAIDTWLKAHRLNVCVLAPQGTKLPDLKADLQDLWKENIEKKAHNDLKSAGKIKTVELGEGRKLILIPDNTMPYTAVNLYMTGGDNLSAAKGKEQGLANLMASVLTSGTKDMTALQMEAFLAERAAGFGARSGRQVFWLASSQPSRFNKDIFKLFQDVLTDASFSEEEIVREKNNQVASIRSRDDKPMAFAFSKLMPFLFGEHPYGYKSLGDIQQIQNYTREDILHFWQKQKEQPWVLSVAGDFDEAEVLAFAHSLPKPTVKESEIAIPTWGQDLKLDLHMPGRDQAHHMLVFKTVNANHPDAVVLEVLQTALTGQSGLLYRELRDKQGLGYSVTASQSIYPKAGFLLFYIGTEPDKLKQAQAGFEKIITQLQNELLTTDQLDKAKNQIEGDYYRSIQSLSSRSHESAIRSILKQDLDFRKKFIEKTKNVTPEDVQRVAQKYLIDSYTIQVTP